MHVLRDTTYTCGGIFVIHSFCLDSAEKVNLRPLFEFRGRKFVTAGPVAGRLCAGQKTAYPPVGARPAAAFGSDTGRSALAAGTAL